MLKNTRKKKKILFVITQSEMGGAQRFLYNLVTNLDNRKYDFIVAAGPQGNNANGLLARLEQKNVKTYPLQFIKREINPINDLRALLEIKRLIEGLRPDIIYLNSTKAGILGSLASRICANGSTKFTTSPSLISRIYSRHPTGGRPQGEKFAAEGEPRQRRVVNSCPLVIYRIGGWSFNEPLSNWKKKMYILAEKWTAKCKDVIITNSQADRKKAIKIGIKPKDKITVVYNGMDTASIRFLPKEKARKKLFSSYKLQTTNYELPIIIGCIANFYPSKGLKYLIEAAKILESRIKNPVPKGRDSLNKIERQESRVYFAIIGDGRERSSLEKLIERYDLKNNFFLVGNILDAHQYLKAFDVFILPSLKEGMPWGLLEAMAAEIPIITTNVGGISEIICKKCGIMVSPARAKELAEAIQILIKNKSLGVSFAKNGKKFIEERFNLRQMIEENEKILDI